MPQLNPGDTIRKSFNGNDYVITVTPRGYEMQGVNYSSLTAVARAMGHVGHLSVSPFFGLQPERRPRDQQQAQPQPPSPTNQHLADELVVAQRTITDLRNRLDRATNALQLARRQQVGASLVSTLQQQVRDLTNERDEARAERDAIAEHLRAILGVLGKLRADKSADDFLADLLASAKDRPTAVQFDAEGGIISGN